MTQSSVYDYNKSNDTRFLSVHQTMLIHDSHLRRKSPADFQVFGIAGKPSKYHLPLDRGREQHSADLQYNDIQRTAVCLASPSPQIAAGIAAAFPFLQSAANLVELCKHNPVCPNFFARNDS